VGTFLRHSVDSTGPTVIRSTVELRVEARKPSPEVAHNVAEKRKISHSVTVNYDL